MRLKETNLNHDPQWRETHNLHSKLNWILIGFLVVAGYFLAMEHKVHLEGFLTYIPYLLLLSSD